VRALPSSGRRPGRRAVLVGAPAALLATVLAGCTGDRRRDADPAPAPPPDPDDALRSAAAERERGLLREYDAVLAALPELAARLAPLRAHHDEHLTALLGASATASPDASAPDAAGGSSDAAAAPSAEPSATAPAAPAVPVPADAASALSRLVSVERAAGAAHAEDCLAASRALAPVLASLSASELSHPVALA
jgi:hypothetical protein